MIDLNPKYLETIQQILAEHVLECEVRAYGSRVKWTAEDYSDLDLAVVGSEPLSLRQLHQLKETFAESDLPIRVDVVDWQSLSDGFKKVIEEKYEVIQKAEPVKERAKSAGICASWGMGNNHWKLVKLGNVVQINPRRTLRRTEVAFHVSMQDIEVFRREITSHSFKEFSGSAARFQNGDTLLARITPCLENGKTVYVNCLKPDQVGHGSTEFIVLSGIEGKTDNLFVYYLARNPILRAFAIHSMQGSTGRQRVMADSLRSFEFSLPPIKEQRRIAHILGTLDEKIELNRQMNETLEAMARAIFKSWFVNFDPVKAKVEGRKPPCMDTETAALFPSAFQDSPLGKIPRGWEIGTLGEIAKNVRRSVKASEIDSSECFIGLEHMPRRNIALSQWQIDAEIASNKYRFRKGGILFGKLNPHFHKVGVAPIDGVCSTDILVIQPIDAGWFGVVLSLISSDNFVAYTTAFSKGTTLPRTNWKDMSNYKTVLPKVEIAHKYSEFIQPIIKRIVENIHQSHTLSQIRDTLLPKLLSGETRVNEAAEILEVKDGEKS
jgi:type I restriction enzyme S subunit